MVNTLDGTAMDTKYIWNDCYVSIPLVHSYEVYNKTLVYGLSIVHYTLCKII